MDKLADNYLMFGVKAGDLDKMTLLFERYSTALYCFAFRSTNDGPKSEDIVQNVFYRMIKYRDSFNGQGDFKTWMYHIARNVITDEFRKNKRVTYLEDISANEKINHGAFNLEHEFDKKSDSQRIHRALSLLNEENREVLILSKFQELSYKEIATILNTNENNIKIKVHRAIKQLKEVYLKLENGTRITK